jgi:hypothetical protein
MNPPYIARIVCRIGSDLIELVRLHRRILPSDIRYWTAGRESRCRVEQPLRSRQCIAPRMAPLGQAAVFERLKRTRSHA